MPNDPLLFYRDMIADLPRLQVYHQAIHAVVRPGDVVVDLGTGTGILASFAAQAGARRVYAVERNPNVIQRARRLAEANGLSDRVTFVHGSIDAITLPEPVDVVVSELIGNMGLEEDTLALLAGANRRLLQPHTRVVPQHLSLYAAPAQADDVWQKRIALWGRDVCGVDFSLVRASAIARTHIIDCSAARLLADPALIADYDLRALDAVPDVQNFSAGYAISQAGTLHGLVGYFDLEAAPGVVLSTAPDQPLTHWEQCFFPIDEPVAVQPGDRITARLKFTLGKRWLWYWSVAVERGGQPVARSDQIELLDPRAPQERLFAQPQFVPRLSQDGQMRRRILALCDGHTSLITIVETLQAEFPDRCAGPGQAWQAVYHALRDNLDG